MKTILITGGAGLIGSTLANHLIDQKFKVIIIDDLSTGKKSVGNSRLQSGSEPLRPPLLKIFTG